MEQKIPRTREAFKLLMERTYNEGYVAGAKAAQAKLHNQAEVRKQALEAATKLATVLGQTIESLARAMQSEAGQL